MMNINIPDPARFPGPESLTQHGPQGTTDWLRSTGGAWDVYDQVGDVGSFKPLQHQDQLWTGTPILFVRLILEKNEQTTAASFH